MVDLRRRPTFLHEPSAGGRNKVYMAREILALTE
jgi:hypothetical protein